MSGSPKVFFANLRDMVERFDARYHSPSFAENIDRIKRGQWRSLGECCKISTETWDRAKLFPDRFPYIEISAINTDLGEITATEELSTAEAPSRAQMVVRGGDILVSMTRPTRNAIARVPDVIGVAIASTGFAVLRSINEGLVSPDYFFHVLRLGFCTMQFDQRSSGGNYPAITKDDLKKTIIPVPPLDVQKQIVAELDAAYKAKRNADEKASRLLASIDDIVSSELELPPLPPQDTSLAARISAVSTSELFGNRLDAYYYQGFFRKIFEMVSSDNRSIHLGRAGEFVRGVTYSSSDENENGLAILRANNVSLGTGELDLSEIVHVRDDMGFDESQHIRPGDILICAASGSKEHAGKVAFVDTVIPNAFAGGFMTILRVDTSVALPRYIAVFMQSSLFRSLIMRHLGGTNINNVSVGMLTRLPVIIPSYSIQQRIVKRVSRIREEAKHIVTYAANTLESVKNNIEEKLIGS